MNKPFENVASSTRTPLTEKELRANWRPVEECACPLCHGAASRVQRQPLDWFINLVRSVHRYRCRTLGCDWQGIRLVSRTRQSPGTIGWS